MTILDNTYPIGLGTSRLPISGPNDKSGFEKSVEIVNYAIELGVNYVDSAPIYSSGMAQKVLKEVIKNSTKSFDTTIKVRSSLSKTKDETLKQAFTQLETLGLSKVKYFISWAIKSYSEFESIMLAGGLYEAAQQLKDEKIIEHICFSIHATPEDTIRIMRSRAFETMTLSYSPLNCISMQEVLDVALELNIGVIVMNPLGGGIIPKNQEYFSFLQNVNEDNTVISALRFIYAHKAIKVVLTGVSSCKELEENIVAFIESDSETNEERNSRVIAKIKDLQGICTGCGYCYGCPQGIPVSSIMQARNTLQFTPSNAYNRDNKELQENIELFRKLNIDYQFSIYSKKNIFNLPLNPCTRCKKCEKNCTQHLNICDSLDDMFVRANKVGYTISAVENRFATIFHTKKYKRVGIYPSGRYASIVLSYYRKCVGLPSLELFFYNSDERTWGTMFEGKLIHTPDQIVTDNLDVIIVANYMYGENIYDELKHFQRSGIDVIKIYDKNSVPWDCT